MDITLDQKSPVNALIKIKLKQEDFQPKVDAKVKDYSKKVNLKGFRPGKVPIGMVKRMYGKSILVEEVNTMLSESLQNYIKENDIKLIGDPLPDRTNQESIDWDNPAELTFDFEIGTIEDFTIDLSKKKKVKSYTIKVDDKPIDETIDNLKQQNGTFEDVEEVSENAVINFNLIGTEKEDSFNISKSLASEKEFKKLFKLKVGDQVDVNLNTLFKDDASLKQGTGYNDDEISNLPDASPIEILSIKEHKEAEITQELFDRVFGKDNVKDEKEFRSKVQEAIQENYKNETDTLLMRDIQELFISKTDINLPDDFLKRWLVETNKDINEDQVNSEYESYTKELKWKLIKDRIASENEIKVEHSDVIETTKKFIRQQFGASGIPKMEDKLDDFADNYLKGNEGQNYMNMFNQVQSDRVMEVIKDKIEIKEESVSIDKFKEIVEN